MPLKVATKVELLFSDSLNFISFSFTSNLFILFSILFSFILIFISLILFSFNPDTSILELETSFNVSITVSK